MLRCYTTLYVQDDNSKELLKSIGVENVVVTGDTRFDRVAQITANSRELPLIKAFAEGSTTWVVGSSWERDEALIVDVLKRHPSCKLILAPHEIYGSHIENIESLFSNFKTLKYSQIKDVEFLKIEKELKEAEVLIIDSIGLLSSIYRYGDFAYIGGGFGVGIHNILEAATYGIPVIFGPNWHRFREARELLTLKGAFSINSLEELEAIVALWMGNKDALLTAGGVCNSYIVENGGATDTIYDSINNFKN